MFRQYKNGCVVSKKKKILPSMFFNKYQLRSLSMWKKIVSFLLKVVHHTKLNQTLYHYVKQKQKLQVQSKQTSNISLRKKNQRNETLSFFTTLKLCVPWLWCRLQVTSVERRCTMCVCDFYYFFFVCV